MDGNKKPPLYIVCDLDYLLCTDNTKQWWGNKKQSVVIYIDGLLFCIGWKPFFFCVWNRWKAETCKCLCYRVIVYWGWQPPSIMLRKGERSEYEKFNWRTRILQHLDQWGAFHFQMEFYQQAGGRSSCEWVSVGVKENGSNNRLSMGSLEEYKHLCVKK